MAGATPGWGAIWASLVGSARPRRWVLSGGNSGSATAHQRRGPDGDQPQGAAEAQKQDQCRPDRKVPFTAQQSS